MADRKCDKIHETHSSPRRGLFLALAFAALSAQAAERQPLEVLVTPDTGKAQYSSAMNEDGVVEANVARIENGIVYLEYRAASGTPRDTLTAGAP